MEVLGQLKHRKNQPRRTSNESQLSSSPWTFVASYHQFTGVYQLPVFRFLCNFNPLK